MVMNAGESEELSSDGDLRLATNRDDYNEVCDEYSKTEVKRTNNLNNMHKIIGRLLKKGNMNVGCQTEPTMGFD